MICDLCTKLGASTILDYGCGKGSLADKLIENGFYCDKYDPAIPEYDKIPNRSYNIVVCNDVLEHLELDGFKEELANIRERTEKAAFFNISCRPAVHHLPDGRNCHTLVMGPKWWIEQIGRAFGPEFLIRIEQFNPRNRNLTLCLVKRHTSENGFDSI